MIELLLFLIIVAQLVGFGFYVFETNKERNNLTNQLIAKNAQELANLKFAEQTKVVAEKPVESPYIPEEELSDEQFDAMIAEQNRVVEQEV